MCPKTGMPAHPCTWELQQACAYSSEYLHPDLAQGPTQPFSRVEPLFLGKLPGVPDRGHLGMSSIRVLAIPQPDQPRGHSQGARSSDTDAHTVPL